MIRFKYSIALLLVVAAIITSPLASAESDSIKKFEKKGLSDFRPPKVRVEILNDGVRCFMLEDHSLPVVRIGVVTRVGGIYDPAEKVGLASLTGQLMRSGGAGALAPKEFDARLDDLGIELSSNVGAEMASSYLTVLSDDIKDGLQLLFDMMLRPRFDGGRLGVAKRAMIEDLKRADDDPKLLATWKYDQLVYGKDSPWARRPTKENIAKIGLEDVKLFHAKYFKPRGMIVTVAGDFNPAKIVAALNGEISHADNSEIVYPEIEKVKLSFEPGFERVDRKTTQAFIRMGHLAIKRDNDDKFALVLLSEILSGSGFKSRLVEDIRSQRGLAYSVGGSISPGSDYGLFQIGVNTSVNQSSKVIELIRSHITKIQETGNVQQSELDLAKRSVLTNLIFDFDVASKVVANKARFAFYGYPDNYWDIYRKRIQGVTSSDIERVAKKYLHPDGLKVLVVGPAGSEKKGDGK